MTLEHGTDGSYLAWVHELPGCFVRAPSREAVDELDLQVGSVAVAVIKSTTVVVEKR